MRGVTLDANIYVSAFEFGGICARLIGMARVGEFRVDVSEPILNEVITVLREDFQWEPYRLYDARQRIMALAECAVEAGSDYIVTRDRDLLRIQKHRGIRIVAPAEFLDLSLTR